MRWFDALFTRGRDLRCFNSVPRHVRPRMTTMLHRLSHEETAIQARMNLVTPPRLTIVDEELAVIVGPRRRGAIELDTDDPVENPNGSLGNS